jgi:hypothetical protein
MLDIKELAMELGSTDPKIKDDAVGVLWDAARNGADISAAISSLANLLWDEDVSIRSDVAVTLENAAKHGADMSAAISALAAALSDADMRVQGSASSALQIAVADVNSCHAALSELVESFSYGTGRWRAAMALEGSIGKCPSLEAVDAAEARLREEYDALKQKRWYGKEAELARIGVSFSRLINETAKRRDALAANRDIMLDDKPKPPKQGPMYQKIRRVLTNG